MRAEIVFHGRVQGVGFRWTACKLAAPRNLRGYVMNRPDGTVELVAEGPARDVREFLDDLKAAFAGYISSWEYNESMEEQGLPPFNVRFHS